MNRRFWPTWSGFGTRRCSCSPVPIRLWKKGHVRVDVFYAGMSARTKGYVNAIGSVVLGMSLCAVILIIGMGGKQNIINSPILTYEVTQAGFGLYVKYLMARVPRGLRRFDDGSVRGLFHGRGRRHSRRTGWP